MLDRELIVYLRPLMTNTPAVAEFEYECDDRCDELLYEIRTSLSAFATGAKPPITADDPSTIMAKFLRVFFIIFSLCWCSEALSHEDRKCTHALTLLRQFAKPASISCNKQRFTRFFQMSCQPPSSSAVQK